MMPGIELTNRIVGRAMSAISRVPFRLYAIAGLLSVFVGLAVIVLGWLSVLLAVSFMLVGIVLFDFRIGVAALMVVLPIAGTKFMPSFSGFNPQNLLILGTFISYLLFRYHRSIPYALIDKKLLYLYFLPFLVAGYFGSIHAAELAQLSANTRETVASPGGFLLYYVAKPALLILMGILIAAAVRESKRPHRFIYPFVVGALIPALIIAVYVPLSGVGLSELVHFRNFLSVLGLHANQFAVALNFSIAVILFVAMAATSARMRSLLLLVVVFLAFTLVLTFSRGGYLGLLVVVAAYFAHFKNWRYLIAGLSVVVFALFLVPDAVIDRVTLGWTHGSEQELSSGRLEGIWTPLMSRVLDSPVFGHGMLYVGRSDLVMSGRMMPVAQAHNAYLDLVLDMGFVGLLLVATFFVKMYQDHKRLSLSDPDPLLRGFFRGASVGVLSVMVMAFFDDRLLPNTPQMFMWMAYGLMLGRRPDMLRVSATFREGDGARSPQELRGAVQ